MTTIFSKWQRNIQQQHKKIGKVIHEFKEGKLKSSSGDKVIQQKQAIAIGISEVKAANLKVPSKKKKSK